MSHTAHKHRMGLFKTSSGCPVLLAFCARGRGFWTPRSLLAPRYYDFNVYRERKLRESWITCIRTQCSADWSRVPRIGRGAVPGTMPPELNARWRLSLTGQPVVVSSSAFIQSGSPPRFS